MNKLRGAGQWRMNDTSRVPLPHSINDNIPTRITDFLGGLINILFVPPIIPSTSTGRVNTVPQNRCPSNSHMVALQDNVVVPDFFGELMNLFSVPPLINPSSSIVAWALFQKTIIRRIRTCFTGDSKWSCWKAENIKSERCVEGFELL